MRVNARKALDAFLSRRSAYPARSVWTNGDHIYSYATCLVARATDGRYILNRTRYSPTTSTHQGALHAALGAAIIVDDIPMGADADALRRAADRLSGNP